jgi:hypothetical protein
MQARRVIGVAVLVIIAFLIVVPPLANGGVKVAMSSSSSVPAEHLYVAVGAIKAHRAGTQELAGWSVITNTSTLVDLATVNSSETVALGPLPLGQYDTISVEVMNATAVINGTSRPAQLMSRVFTVPAPFLVRLGVQTSIMLKVVPELHETPDIISLELSFTAGET